MVTLSSWSANKTRTNIWKSVEIKCTLVTYLCVNYNIIKTPPCNNLKPRCVGDVTDCDQVG